MDFAGPAGATRRRPSRRMGFRTIEGRLLERDMATVYISTDKYSVPDVVVAAEDGEMEVMGAMQVMKVGDKTSSTNRYTLARTQ